MKVLRALVVSLVLLGLLAPMAMAHPKPDAAHVPHEIMPDDAAWAATFGGTTFADLWVDLTSEAWGKVMELPFTDRFWEQYGPFGGEWAVYRAVPIGFNFKFMQGPARGVPSYAWDPTCDKMYPEGDGPGCYVAYKWSWKLRDDGYDGCWVAPFGMIVFPDVTWNPKEEPEVLRGSWNYWHPDFSREPPNNYIAPFWDDFALGNNDYYDADFIYNAADIRIGYWDNGWVRRPRGRLLYATLGEAPNRTFVVEWLNAREWGTGFLASFELQLFEGSNAILFLYKEFVGKPGNPEWFTTRRVLIGMEDLFGVTFVGDLYVPYYERMPAPVANESVRGFVY